MKAWGIPPAAWRVLAWGAFASSGLWHQTAVAQPVIGEGSIAPIIYGSDDRQDYYEVDDTTYQDVARRSVVSLISPANLQRTASGIEPVDITLGEQLLCVTNTDCVEMCPDERFLDQPSAGECSGVLVDDDLVLTAGHCFNDADDCGRYRYVFDFFYKAEGELAHISSDDIYGCESLVLWTVPPEVGQESQDYALVKLDRAVDASREPATLRADALAQGDMVAALGFPIGLPLKIDRGGEVQDARPRAHDYFTATTDTYVGNSGSGMFDENGHLVGHLVTGGSDFDIDPERECLSSVVIPEGARASLYEHGVYVDTWRSVLCDSGYDSDRLCGDAAPPIKSPIEPGDVDGGTTIGRVPKSSRGCRAAPGSFGGFAFAQLFVLAALLVRRRARV